ncbi:MAG: hypothetical protein JWQ43_1730 [Glaciihabitans sp.]|nr:hypothetical protein [Glaciihabitans sp.]
MNQSGAFLTAFLAAVQSLSGRAALAANRPAALDTVARAAALRTDLDAVLAALVDDARASGATWQELGTIFGISRQAAFQRFGHPVDPRTGEPMNTTPLDEAPTIATAVFQDLAEAKWQAVTARFDERMTAGLDADALAAAWAQVIGTVGAFDEAKAPVATRAADVTVVDVPLRFEAGEMVGRLAVRDDGTIAGLFILDPAAATGSEATK